MRPAGLSERTLGDELEQYHLLLDCLSDHALLVLDAEGCVASWNAGAERIFGHPPDEALGRHFSFLFVPEDRDAGFPRRELEAAAAQGRADDDRWLARRDGTRMWAAGVTAALVGEAGTLRGFAKVVRDRTEAKRAEEERESLVDRLQQALAAVKTLRGLLPICAWCRKVRDDEGYWSRLEAYFQEHLDVTFTHGICPACAEEVAPAASSSPIPPAAAGPG